MASWKDSLYRGLEKALVKEAAPAWVKTLQTKATNARPYFKTLGEAAGTATNLAFGAVMVKTLIDAIKASNEDKRLKKEQEEYYKAVKALQNRSQMKMAAVEAKPKTDTSMDLGEAVGAPSEASLDPLTNYLINH